MALSSGPADAAQVRRPDASDRAAFARLVGRPWATITSIAIVDEYALVSWSAGPIGGQVLAVKTAGVWRQRDAVHGAFAVTDLAADDPWIPPSIAQKLVMEAARNDTKGP